MFRTLQRCVRRNKCAASFSVAAIADVLWCTASQILAVIMQAIL
jgi:hypothetical protein